jgi:hypothetical protein
MELYFYFTSRPSWHARDNFAFYRISIKIKYEDGLFSSGVMFIPIVGLKYFRLFNTYYKGTNTWS